MRDATAALRALGSNAFGAALDVADGVALKSWIAQAGATLGGIDILIANPSAFGIGASEEDWKMLRCRSHGDGARGASGHSVSGIGSE